MRKVEDKQPAIKVPGDPFTLGYLKEVIAHACSTLGRNREAAKYFAAEAARDAASGSGALADTPGSASGAAGQTRPIASSSPTGQGEDSGMGPEASAASGQTRSGTTAGTVAQTGSSRRGALAPLVGSPVGRSASSFASLFAPKCLVEMSKTIKFLLDADEADYK